MKKFFKDAEGRWHIGYQSMFTKNGVWSFSHNDEKTEVYIKVNGFPVVGGKIVDIIKNEAGDKYASFEEFDAVVSDFFVDASGSGSALWGKISGNIQDQLDLLNLIAQLQKVVIVSVDELPETGETNIIYLVPKAEPNPNNIKDEFIWIVEDETGFWEHIGTTDINLAWGNISGNLSDQTDLATILNNKAAKLNIPINSVPLRTLLGIGEPNASASLAFEAVNSTIPLRTTTGQVRGANAVQSTDLVSLGQLPSLVGRFIEAECNSGYGVAAKIATTTAGNYIPQKGDTIEINFTLGTNVNTPTLNIDGSGVKNIMVSGNNTTAASGLLPFYVAPTGGKVRIYYDGSNYLSYGVLYNWVYTLLSTEDIANSTTTLKVISGEIANHIINKAREVIPVTIDTALVTAAKVGTTTAGNYVPKVGDEFDLLFVNGTNAGGVTLSIDNSTAYNITMAGSNVTGASGTFPLFSNANGTIRCWFNGSAFISYGATYNISYAEIPEEEINGGISGSLRTISGRRAEYIIVSAKNRTINEADDITLYPGFDLEKKVALICDHGAMKWQEIE